MGQECFTTIQSKRMDETAAVTVIGGNKHTSRKNTA